MTDAEFRKALQKIISTSSSVDEVRLRVARELGCACGLDISVLPAEAEFVGRGAVTLGRLKRGCVLRSGDALWVRVKGPSGAMVSI